MKKMILFIILIFLTLNVFAGVQLQQGGADSSTVGLWHLNKGSGTVVYDTSGNKYNGTITNALWTNGYIGKGLSFDGDGDYVSVSGSKLNITKNITLEAWINLNLHVNDVYPSIIFKGLKYFIQIVKNNASAPQPRTLRGGVDTGALAYATSSGKISTGTWNHVAMVYNGLNIFLYINGNQDGSKSDSGDIEITGDDVIIGKYSTTNYFNGIIDEVSIYDRALSAAEILKNYNEQKNKY